MFLQHTLETALLSASQEIELGSENSAALQSVIQQRDLLQSGLLSTCRELTRVTAVSTAPHCMHELMSALTPSYYLQGFKRIMTFKCFKALRFVKKLNNLQNIISILYLTFEIEGFLVSRFLEQFHNYDYFSFKEMFQLAFKEGFFFLGNQFKINHWNNQSVRKNVPTVLQHTKLADTCILHEAQCRQFFSSRVRSMCWNSPLFPHLGLVSLQTVSYSIFC